MKCNPVIFLDIDGVMISNSNIERCYIENGRRTVPSAIPFDKTAMRCLKKLVEETKADIVLSSTWRMSDELIEYFKEQMREIGLLDKYIGNTCRMEWRQDEIAKWVCDNKFKGKFIVIDDDIFDLTNYEDVLVKTDIKYGFTEEKLKEAFIKFKKERN